MIWEWIGNKFMKAAVAKVDAADLDAAVSANPRHHFQVMPDEVISSKLEPPSFFGGKGMHPARWKLAVRGRKPVVYYIEDTESLDVAIDHLPDLLGEVHQATIRRRE